MRTLLRIYYLIFISCVFALSSATAQMPVVFNENNKDFTELAEHIRVYADTTNALSYVDILAIDDSLFTSTKIDLQRGVPYWVKIKAYNATNQDVYRYIAWHSFLGRNLNFLEAYILDDTFQLHKAADFGFFRPKSAHKNSLNWNTIDFFFRPKTNYTILLKVHNPSLHNFNFNIHIVSPSYELAENSMTDLQNMLLEGMFVILILYFLLLFASSSDKAYLYFSLYLLSLAIFAFLNYRYPFFSLFNNTPELQPTLSIVAFGSSVVFFWLLVDKLFDIRTRLSQVWHRSIRLIVRVKLVLLAILFIAYFAIGYHAIFHLIVLSIAPLEGLFSFLLLLQLRKQDNKLFRIFMIGAVGFGFIFFTTLAMYAMQHPQALLLAQFGVTFEIIVFAFGLNARAIDKEQIKRRVQGEHINMLQENEEQLQNHKEELEEKVKQRTIEMSSQQEEIQAQNDQLTTTYDKLNISYKQIKDSIHYAKKIQTAVLPQPDEINEVLTNYFIYFRPRDIVSGDFYWAKQIGDKLLVAAVDCTGHGVPGAFLSLLGVSFLNEIATEYASNSNSIKAADVLMRLRDKVKIALRQEENATKAAREAMDISLCVVDKKEGKLQFSGAHNPLYRVRQGELIEYKGDRMPISFQKREQAFTNYEINLTKGDRFYLFSDGFVDQFGGYNGDKYKTRRFKSTILSMNSVPINSQGELFDKLFNDWRKNTKQIDDVLIIGFEV